MTLEVQANYIGTKPGFGLFNSHVIQSKDYITQGNRKAPDFVIESKTYRVQFTITEMLFCVYSNQLGKGVKFITEKYNWTDISLDVFSVSWDLLPVVVKYRVIANSCSVFFFINFNSLMCRKFGLSSLN